MATDVIIIGGGVMGAAAAYNLTSKGYKVIVLEQHDFLHEKGSSGGRSRIIRLLYNEFHNAKLIREAYQLLREAEMESGAKIFHQTGEIDLGKKDNPQLNSIVNNAKTLDIKINILNKDDLHKTFNVSEGYMGVHQEDSGILDPHSTMKMFLGLARKHGAILHDQEVVMGINSYSGGLIRIVTIDKRNHTNRVYSCRFLVIAAGAWTPKIMQHSLPHIRYPYIKILKQTWVYFPIYDSHLNHYTKSSIFINYENGLYGFPQYEKPGYIKVAMHYDDGASIVIDPDNRSYEPEAKQVKLIADKVKELLPGIDWSKPTDPETCLYSKTFDGQFIIDTLPDNPNICVIGGGSGHMFKFCALIGRLVYELLIDKHKRDDIKPFAIDRHIKSRL